MVLGVRDQCPKKVFISFTLDHDRPHVPPPTPIDENSAGKDNPPTGRITRGQGPKISQNVRTNVKMTH